MPLIMSLKKPVLTVTAALVLPTLVIHGIYRYSVAQAEEASSPKAETAIEETAPKTVEEPTSKQDEENEESSSSYILKTKAIGNPDAPVIIKEYSALTCGHCGHFHKDVLPEIKKEYIETGKVYYIYNDFPYNKPALDAAMMTRCMPEDKFWNFLAFLFTNQDKWAYGSKDYAKSLKQNAMLAGLSKEKAEACLNNREMAKALANQVGEASKKYSINSTPTFIIEAEGKEETILGNRPVKTFKEKIDALLLGKNDEKEQE